jgi:hypothetical protein
VDKHSFDFADARFQLTNRSATDSFIIDVCNQKHEPTIRDVHGTKSVRRNAGISSTQLIVERRDEVNRLF